MASFFTKVSRSLKSVVRSPILQAVVGGVAIVFPVVGVPALAALATANMSLKAAEESKSKMRKLTKSLKLTKVAAQRGDKGAQRALAAFTVVHAARKGNPQALAQVRSIVRTGTLGAKISSRYRTQSNGRLRRVA